MSAPCLYIKTLTDDCSIERKRYFGRSRVTKFNSFIFQSGSGCCGRLEENKGSLTMRIKKTIPDWNGLSSSYSAFQRPVACRSQLFRHRFIPSAVWMHTVN